MHSAGYVLSCNRFSIALIVLRLWKVDRESSLYTYRSETESSVPTRARPSSNLRRAMIIIIEAGAMYTAVAVIVCGTYIGGSTAAYFTSDVVSQISSFDPGQFAHCRPGSPSCRHCLQPHHH